MAQFEVCSSENSTRVAYEKSHIYTVTIVHLRKFAANPKYTIPYYCVSAIMVKSISARD